MYQSLRALVADLIDYAGLFPPAALPLQSALRNYIGYKASADAWMLGRFICPADRLGELGAFGVALKAPMLPIAAIGRKSEAGSFLRTLGEDVAAIAAARRRYGTIIEIDLFELPLPPGSVTAELLAGLAEVAHAAGLAVFCEVQASLDASWEGSIAHATAALAAHNATGEHQLGYKLRTGGVTTEAFPSPAQLARAIVAARDSGLATKFTAGLHHPFRQYRDEVATQMHGFVNVFVAGLLAHAHGLDAVAIARILDDEDPTAFVFDDEGLGWRDLRVPTERVVELRRRALISYGSCSFDEPRDDLRAVGML
jgi:hypothetical protein